MKEKNHNTPQVNTVGDQHCYIGSDEHHRSLELLRKFGSRTDMNRVLIWCDDYDICLSEQTESVGEYDWGFIIEITETRCNSA